MIEIILIVAFVSILTILELPAYDPWRKQTFMSLIRPRHARMTGHWSGFT